MGTKISKLLLTQVSFESFQTFSEFLLSGSHKSTVLDFGNFEFFIFKKNLKFTILSYGKTKNLNWKTRDRRAKQSKIWASGVSIQYIQDTLDS